MSFLVRKIPTESTPKKQTPPLTAIAPQQLDLGIYGVFSFVLINKYVHIIDNKT
jgi:hypothetical protein